MAQGMQGKGSLEGSILPKLPEGVSVAKCAWRVRTDAVGGSGRGVGQSPRGTATGDRGHRQKRDQAEGARKEGGDERRREAGSAPSPFSAPGASGVPPSPLRRPRRPPAPVGPGAFPDPSAGSALRDAGEGEGPTPQPVPAWGGGYCEEGRKAHLKFRDICSPREETLGARSLGAPPAGPVGCSRSRTPAPPTQPLPDRAPTPATNAGGRGRERGRRAWDLALEGGH